MFDTERWDSRYGGNQLHIIKDNYKLYEDFSLHRRLASQPSTHPNSYLYTHIHIPYSYILYISTIYIYITSVWILVYNCVHVFNCVQDVAILCSQCYLPILVMESLLFTYFLYRSVCQSQSPDLSLPAPISTITFGKH